MVAVYYVQLLLGDRIGNSLKNHAVASKGHGHYSLTQRYGATHLHINLLTLFVYILSMSKEFINSIIESTSRIG